jgi:hypothetical protein
MNATRPLHRNRRYPALLLALLSIPSPTLAEPEAEPPEAPPRPRPALDGPSEIPATQERQPTQQEIARALRAYDREPRVWQLVKAALRFADADPDRARAMASRARMAGWVPALKLAVRRGLTRDLSEYQTLETDRTNLSTDHDLVLEASLTFDLARLVFDHDEIALAREQRKAVQARAELARAVVALYFERRRLQLERDLLDGADLVRAVRIAELEALLDAFTDGAFRRMIVSLERRASGKP